MTGLRAPATSEHTAPAAPATDDATAPENPLLKLFEQAPPAKLAPLLLDQLKILKPSRQAAQWIDQLLADPRLDSVAGARADAVATLLDFGHPWALTAPPEDLLRFRKYRAGHRPSWFRNGIVALGAAAGIAASLYSARFAPSWRSETSPWLFEFAGLAGSTAGVVWSLSIVVRAAAGLSGLARSILFREVPIFALVVFGTLLFSWGSALPLLGALLPVLLAARISWRLDPDRQPP